MKRDKIEKTEVNMLFDNEFDIESNILSSNEYSKESRLINIYLISRY